MTASLSPATTTGTDDPVYRVPPPSPSAPDEVSVPALAFGLYMVPDTAEGEKIIIDAIRDAGYRHFDSATAYGNERTLGRALARAGVPRAELTIAGKVWNDAQRGGRAAVRASVEASLADIGTAYLDICYVHWPVPGCLVDTYRELQELQKGGKIRHLGISNFGIADYEELVNAEGITVRPLINQIEVSPFMYRPQTIRYFQERGVLVAASKALHRGAGIAGDGSDVVATIAASHGVTPAQVLLRWGLQHSLVVLAKTSRLERMRENRDVLSFTLLEEEMLELVGLTSEDAIQAREEIENERKCSV
jgi:diketogulonate reductase-like aldo/keto reductase